MWTDIIRNLGCVRFKVLTALLMKTSTFWDGTVLTGIWVSAFQKSLLAPNLSHLHTRISQIYVVAEIFSGWNIQIEPLLSFRQFGFNILIMLYS
jgi:hypothetical protein